MNIRTPVLGLCAVVLCFQWSASAIAATVPAYVVSRSGDTFYLLVSTTGEAYLLDASGSNGCDDVISTLHSTVSLDIAPDASTASITYGDPSNTCRAAEFAGLINEFRDEAGVRAPFR